MPESSRRPKIVFLVMAVDAVGGTEIAAKRQAAGLSREFDVELVSVFNIGSMDVGVSTGGATVTYLLGREARSPRYGSILADLRNDQRMREQADLALAEYLASIQSDPEIAAIFSMSPLFLRPLSLFYRGRAKIFHQEHRRTETRGRLQEIFIYGPTCDAILVLTERTRAALEEYVGSRGPAIRLIRNGIERSRIRALPERPRVVLAGRLTLEKQCDHAIAAFSEVLRKLPDAELLVCGEGPERASLQALVQGSGLQDHVSFVGTVDMERVWPSTSVGLLSSLSEALPLVILEANAHGVPYVAYESGDGVRELIDHSRTGLIVNQGDASALGCALADLLSSHERLAAFSEAAFDKVAQFDPAAMTNGLTDLIRSVPARPPNRKRQVVRRRLAAPSAHGHRSQRGESAMVKACERLRPLGYRVFGNRAYLPAEAVPPIDARNRNARLAIDALRAAAARWVFQPQADWTKSVMFMERAQRGAALDHLRSACQELPVYIEPLFEGDNRGPVEHISSFTEAGQHRPVRAFRIYISYANSDGSVKWGGEYSTILRLADFRDDGSILLHDKTGDEILYSEPCIFKDLWIGELPTCIQFLSGLPKAHMDPVLDAVYLVRSPAGKAPHADELLRYSLRSLAYFAPWIRRVILIAEPPLPAWLELQSSFVQVFRHCELLGYSETAAGQLNPNSIEACIPSITGLSANFLLLDSGTILNSAASAESFYDRQGRAKVLRSGPLQRRQDQNDVWTRSRIYTADCVRRVIGFCYYDEYRYAPHAFERNALTELQARFADQLAATASRSSPSANDFVLLTQGYQEYARATGQAELGSSTVHRHSLRHGTAETLNEELQGGKSDIISIGDAQEVGGPPPESYSLALETKFPSRSPAEIVT